ncbi:MAG: sulfite exporter TauE/SafE family protein [Rhodospirillales bacterium]|nr:sulfite exporter TauE/SafE family protein [Rhodospirillales bacterium]
MPIGNLVFQPTYIVSGLLVGLLVGLTGVGGGSLMTPLLVLLFGFHPSMAVGTDLLFAAVTKTVGTAVHTTGKTVDWRIVWRLAMGSVPATLVSTAVMAHYGAASEAIAAATSYTLGMALLLSATSLLFKERIIRAITKARPDFGARESLRLTIITGFVLGILVSFSSVGAGALGTIALIILYPSLPMVRIVGSDIAHAVPLTLLAGLGHWLLGSINFHLLGELLIGSVPGIIIGSLLARYAPDKALKLCLGVILAITGLRMLLK